ncbi:MAG TPA: GntG family PLP-dependent aldolase [Conexivisphaerales archaeon]|nr:GntG family PLP-dependent aldolase [Conexivisphaerales archaeon]
MADAPVDLRSDTVTLPTKEMLEAIRTAKLGDDVYGEDPTVSKLEEMAAERMGKEAALLVTSGTQANLVSTLSNTKRGDSVIVEAESHIYWNEVGGMSTVAGVLPWPVRGHLGALDPEDVEAAIRPKNIHYPDTTVVCIEDTHNRAGGTVITPAQIGAVEEVAHAHGLKLYMDGARIFNASVALGVDVKEFTKRVDSLMFCLSKGLSCPVGSLVVGDTEFVGRARKYRKMLGGGMRQAGIIAAPGIVALEKMVGRLAEDHRNAKLLAEGLAKIDGIEIDLKAVQTNMVAFDVRGLGLTAHQFVDSAQEFGVLCGDVDEYRVRMVTHRGIVKEDIDRTLLCVQKMTKRRGRV